METELFQPASEGSCASQKLHCPVTCTSLN